MRRARGFTMIEVVIVMAILAIVTVPFLDMVAASYAHFHALALQADMKAEADGASARIFRLAAAGARLHIDADNHGVTAGKTRVRWEDGRLVLMDGSGKRDLVSHRVTEFVVTRSHAVLTIHLAVTAPARNHGKDVTFRYIYDYPSITDLASTPPSSTGGRRAGE